MMEIIKKALPINGQCFNFFHKRDLHHKKIGNERYNKGNNAKESRCNNA